jgi:death-on-curing protein
MAEGNGQALEEWFELLVAEIREAHELVLKTGGAAGERTALLLATAGRPFQSAFGRPLYATDIEKAAALFHGIIRNHPFTDGNKRTATLVSLYFLVARAQLKAPPDPIHIRLLGEIAIETALGNLTVEEIVAWFRALLADLLTTTS